MIPVDVRKQLEAVVEEDLVGATVVGISICVNCAGQLTMNSIKIRRQDGREILIGPDLTYGLDEIILEVRDGDLWRELTIADDYSEELEMRTHGVFVVTLSGRSRKVHEKSRQRHFRSNGGPSGQIPELEDGNARKGGMKKHD